MPRALHVAVLCAALALILSQQAAGQLANGGFFDPNGDVTTGADGRFVVPDILGGSFGFGEGLPASPDDDVLSGTMYEQAAIGSPGPAGPSLRQGQLLTWWIDADGDAATGEADGPAGWDWLLESEGVAGALPASVTVYRWDPGERAYLQTRTATITASRPMGSGLSFWSWSLPAAELGVVRGRTALFAVATSDPALDASVPANRDDTSIVPLEVPPPPLPVIGATQVAGDGPGTATLRTGINPRGSATTWFVRYGLDAPTLTTPVGDAGQGGTAAPVSVALTGLRPGSTYLYQVVATNRWGQAAGPVATFRTLDAQISTVDVATGVPLEVTATSAVLTGTLDPQGRALNWWFEWRGGSGVTRTTARTEVPAGRFGARPVSAPLSALVPGTRHSVTLVAEIDGVRRAGEEIAFSTAPGLTLTVTARGRCGSGGCAIRTLRSAIAGPASGLRVTVRCLRGCRLPRGPRSRAGRTADLAPLLGGRLPLGAVVRVTATAAGLPPDVAVLRATRRGLRVTAG